MVNRSYKQVYFVWILDMLESRELISCGIVGSDGKINYMVISS